MSSTEQHVSSNNSSSVVALEIEPGFPENFYQDVYISAFDAPLDTSSGKVIRVGSEYYRVLEEVPGYSPEVDNILLQPSLGNMLVEGACDTFEECFDPLASDLGSIETRTCTFRECYDLPRLTGGEGPYDEFLEAVQRYEKLTTKFNGFPAYSGVTYPNWWIVYATYRDGLSTGWIVFKGKSLWSYKKPIVALYGDNECGVGTEVGGGHPCIEGRYCYGNPLQVEAFIDPLFGPCDEPEPEPGPIDGESCSTGFLSIASPSSTAAEDSSPGPELTVDSSSSSPELTVDSSSSSLKLIGSSSSSSLSESLLAIYEPCDVLGSSSALSTSTSPPCTEYLELEPCFPHIFEACWFICESYIPEIYEIGDTVNIRLSAERGAEDLWQDGCYQIGGRKDTEIGAEPDCIWPTVVVLPQPDEVTGPYSDCEDCCEYYRLSPCFPDTLEKCTFVAKEHIPFDVSVGDTINIDGLCYEIGDCVLDTTCPDTWSIVELVPTTVSGPYDSCVTCEGTQSSSSSSLGSESIIAIYEPCTIFIPPSLNSSSEDISSGGCDYADCYEFTFTHTDDLADDGADQQYVENGTFNGYPAFQGQTDPDWWLLYGTIGVETVPFTGWLLQKSGSSPDIGGYITLFGTPDCTVPGFYDQKHPCPEGGYCHGTSEGYMAKGCQPSDIRSSSSISPSSSSIIPSSSSIIPSSSSIIPSSSTARLARYIPCDIFTSSSTSLSSTSSSSTIPRSFPTIPRSSSEDSSEGCVGYWGGVGSPSFVAMSIDTDFYTFLDASGCSAYAYGESSDTDYKGKFVYNEAADYWIVDQPPAPDLEDRIYLSDTTGQEEARIYADYTWIRFLADGDLPGTGTWELQFSILSPSNDISWRGTQICGTGPLGRYYRDQVRCGVGPEFIDIISL